MNLKPCPFCGSKDIYVYRHQHTGYTTIGCENDECEASIAGDDREEAEEKWNRRAGEEKE